MKSLSYWCIKGNIFFISNSLSCIISDNDVVFFIIETISLNFLNSNNYNLNDAQIFENNKENSYYDKDLNEKIIKLFIGDHPLLPMKTIEKIAHCNFMNQHYKGKDYYNTKVIAPPTDCEIPDFRRYIYQSYSYLLLIFYTYE